MSVLLALALAAWAEDPARGRSKEVRLRTSDGWSLSASYTKAGAPAVILLHGLAAGKSEWEPLVKALAERGVSSLAVDLRGHGTGSGPKGQKSWREFVDMGPDGEWARMANDPLAAAEYLRAKGHAAIGVLGASLGANAAFAAAAGEKRFKIAVLMSPGAEYQGLRAPEQASRYGTRPLLLMAAPDDPYAFRTVELLRGLRLAAKLPASVIEAPSGHGAQMLRDPESLKRLAVWIHEHLKETARR